MVDRFEDGNTVLTVALSAMLAMFAVRPVQILFVD